MANLIQKPTPPALPLATETYQKAYTDQSNNVLRLFFNRLTQAFNSLLSVNDGGRFLYFPRGLFYDTTAQNAAAINTAYAITYDNTYLGNGVSLEDSSKIYVEADGVYNFQFSAQADKNSSNDKIVWLWIRKSGVDVEPSAREYHIRGPTPLAWSFNIDMDAGDYIEMMWAVTDTDIFIHGEAATSPHPGIPSAVMAVTFVSNL